MRNRAVDILTLVDASTEAGVLRVPAHLVGTEYEFNDRGEADGVILNHWQDRRVAVWKMSTAMAARYAQELQALLPEADRRRFTADFLRHYQQETGLHIETLRQHLKRGWWYPETVEEPSDDPDLPPKVIVVQDYRTALSVFDAALEVLAYGFEHDPFAWVQLAQQNEWKAQELTQHIKAALDPAHDQTIVSHKNLHNSEYTVIEPDAVMAYTKDAIWTALHSLPDDPNRGELVSVEIKVVGRFERTATPKTA